MTIHTNQFKVNHRKSTGETTPIDIKVFQYLLQVIAEDAIETVNAPECEDIEIINISSKEATYGGVEITCNIKITNANFLFNLYSTYTFDCSFELVNIDTVMSKSRIN